MEKLNFDQMEQVNGGDGACAAAVAGVVVSAIGGLISMATLQPWGIALGVAGIYAGAGGIYMSC